MARNLGLKPETLWDSTLALSGCVSKALLAVGRFFGIDCLLAEVYQQRAEENKCSWRFNSMIT
jgi:hypothetical protein